VAELAFLVGLRQDLQKQIEQRSGPVGRRDLKPSEV
ncbi:membrane protein, partial [Pseudomonas taetrolens]